MFKIIFQPQTYKFLKRLPCKQAILILKRLEEMAQDPFKSRLDIRRMKATARSWRLRLGKIRVVYEILGKERIIWINKIKFRGDVYR